jgi:hypothetical protein
MPHGRFCLPNPRLKRQATSDDQPHLKRARRKQKTIHRKQLVRELAPFRCIDSGGRGVSPRLHRRTCYGPLTTSRQAL